MQQETKPITFLRDPELIKEYLEDECLNEMDFYEMQLLVDGVIKPADPYPGYGDKETRYFEFTDNYMGFLDGMIVYYIGFKGLPEYLAICDKDDFTCDCPMYIVKVESIYGTIPGIE